MKYKITTLALVMIFLGTAAFAAPAPSFHGGGFGHGFGHPGYAGPHFGGGPRFGAGPRFAPAPVFRGGYGYRPGFYGPRVGFGVGPVVPPVVVGGYYGPRVYAPAPYYAPRPRVYAPVPYVRGYYGHRGGYRRW
jgi:hypothetical protein